MTPEMADMFLRKLDKIIELLELRNSIEQAKNEMIDSSDTFWKNCNCGEHKHGELTGGWWCPIHGRQF